MSANLINSWRGAKVFVLGDVMLDKFIYGSVERVSPEAPIPVLNFQSEATMLGGAANVARNIVALGGQAVLGGTLGDDAEADLIEKHLVAEHGIEGRFVRFENHPTIVKTRFTCGNQQIMRLDVERTFKLNERHVDQFHDYLQGIAADISVVVLSDYAKGVVIPAVIRRILDCAQAHDIPVIVDPKTRDVQRYAGATILTPNAAEAAAIVGYSCADDEHAARAAREIARRAEVKAVVLTRGAQGMTVCDLSANSKVTHIATTATEVFDVSGAGDTAVAALSLALSGGASFVTAARVANAAASVAVSKRGTAAVQAQELASALGGFLGARNPKIVDRATAGALAADWKAQGLKVGFTNGCFDLLHPGHVELLKCARAACDKLIVALNTDASVKRLKGKTRPIQNQQARSIVMAALDSVDLVTLFDEDTPQALIELLRPDCLIKGSDYTMSEVVGAEFVTGYGGKVLLVPLKAGHSTSSMIAQATAKA